MFPIVPGPMPPPPDGWPAPGPSPGGWIEATVEAYFYHTDQPAELLPITREYVPEANLRINVYTEGGYPPVSALIPAGLTFETAVVTLQPAANLTFSHWLLNGSHVGNAQILRVVASNDMTLTAVFSRESYAVDLHPSITLSFRGGQQYLPTESRSWVYLDAHPTATQPGPGLIMDAPVHLYVSKDGGPWVDKGLFTWRDDYQSYHYAYAVMFWEPGSYRFQARLPTYDTVYTPYMGELAEVMFPTTVHAAESNILSVDVSQKPWWGWIPDLFGEGLPLLLLGGVALIALAGRD